MMITALNNNEYPTANTSLAAYLKTIGYTLLITNYRKLPGRNKTQGVFLFDATDKSIHDHISLFNKCEAICNVVIFENVRNELLDKVRRGMP